MSIEFTGAGARAPVGMAVEMVYARRWNVMRRITGDGGDELDDRRGRGVGESFVRDCGSTCGCLSV